MRHPFLEDSTPEGLGYGFLSDYLLELPGAVAPGDDFVFHPLPQIQQKQPLCMNIFDALLENGILPDRGIPYR